MEKKVMVVTGSSSGLGLAIVGQAIETGMKVYGLDSSTDRAKNYADITNPQSIKRWKLWNTSNKVDILINCAGINLIDKIEDVTLEDFRKVMAVNVEGIFNMTQALLPLLKKSKGTICNIVSNAAHMPMTHSIAYNASKGAAEIMTRQMARELIKSHDVTVFGINPAKLEGTGMSKYIESRVPEMRGWTPEEAKEYQMKSLGAGFEIKPEWIAELIVWLLQKDYRHKYLNGCILDLGL